MDDKTKAKIGAGIIAGTMIGGGMPVLAAENKPVENYSNESYVDFAEIDTQKVLENLYEEQMNTLVPALENLKKFYTDVDTKNIIKTAYRSAYEKVFTDLGYMIVNYGGTSYYNYIPATQDYLGEIIKNNNLINDLRIRPAGNAREPDYGIITDPSTALGFRTKTEEDRALIDSYSNILDKVKYIDNSVISLIVAINNNENIDEVLLYALKNIYEEQRNYLYSVKPQLENFYTDVDTKNIIKTAYSYAYDALKIPLDDSILLDEQTNLTNVYISLISRNNNILNSLKIKSAGNARDTDYGVIMDPNSEYGFRIKTEEDKNLIEQYSSIIENRPIISNDLLNLFIKAQSLTQSGPTR